MKSIKERRKKNKDLNHKKKQKYQEQLNARLKPFSTEEENATRGRGERRIHFDLQQPS